jgi:flagellar basal-body rod modification protein FlgD
MTAPVTQTTPGNSVADILAKQQANAATAGSGSSGATGTDSSQSTDDALSDLSGNYSNFLTLLTTQLQNQDPLSPMDTNQFTQQLVEFSSVEQQINGNKKLDQMIALQSTANAYGAVGFVGTSISATSDQLPLQNGSARFDYTIEHDASAATLKIMDSSGNIVMLEQVDGTVGTHPVQWDGTDFFGNQLPDGQYSVSVSYQDSAGTSYDAPTTTYGTVDSAEIDNGTVSLKLGDVTIPLDQVTSVTRPGDPTTPPPASGGDGSSGDDSGDSGSGDGDSSGDTDGTTPTT